MTIDIERLKHDREYWDSVAPEGATHFQPDKGKSFSWYDIEKKKVFCNPGNRWIESWSPKEYWDSLIPRPSPTWNGEGLPPVGVECEIAMISAPVKIVAHVKEGEDTIAVYQCLKENDWGAHSANKFRPLKTEKERVVDYWLAKMPYPVGKSTKMDIDALYDAGALKMPGGE